MALKPLNSINGFSVGSTGNVVIFANLDVVGSNVSAANALTGNTLTINGISNLNSISNVRITGGSSGQSLITDGNGNLSFANAASNIAAPMPYFIPTGKSYIVPENFQGLFATPIVIDGDLEIDGQLIDVSRPITAANNQVLFAEANYAVGNTGFTFSSASGNLSVPGNIISSGDLLPNANVTYSLGSNTKRWNNLYLAGNTIFLGESTLSTDANGAITLLNATGGELIVAGNANLTTLESGNSNITITTNGNVITSVSGNANVLIVTGTGINVAGTINSTGNIVAPNFVGNLAGSNINLGLNANTITIGSNTSTVTVRNDLDVSGIIDSPSIMVGDLYSRRSAIPINSANTVVDSFPIGDFRSAKYTVRASSDLGYQALEVLLVHDDINSIVTIYGSLSTAVGNVDIVTLSTAISSGNVELRATGFEANTKVNLMGTYVPD